jgi:diguanylate cyclase (GGDEF)-like protein/PAS domain S-box-containing protein
VNKTEPDAQLRVVVTLWSRGAPAVVCLMSALNWLGWATGTLRLTRVFRSWPQMTPWSALLLATLAVSILVQSGSPSRGRARFGCGLAIAAGAVAVAILTEYATSRAFGLDLTWFPREVSTLQRTWPGRPSPQTAVTVLLLAVGVGLTRLDYPSIRMVRTVSLVSATVLPFVVAAAYVFQALSVIQVTPSTGMAISTSLALLLLATAAFAARPDWNPVAWLLARPDGRTLVRMVGVLAGLPIVVGLSRLAFLTLGLPQDAAWALAISVSTIAVGVAMFYLGQREQRLLIDRERLSRERADAEARYRILADNAVDTVVRLDGATVTWISPSVEAAFGDPPSQWIGSDFSHRIHPDDRDLIVVGSQRMTGDEAPVERFRVCVAGGGYCWVDCRCKPYLDADGRADGVIAALRVVDDQVEAERRLERLARFDGLTGLANRAEAIGRLEAALEGPSTPGSYVGILFCDVDDFKDINDTYGHSVGDLVLVVFAERICECVRDGDTVGRTGGDEMLVLLPGVNGLDEAAEIAERIRLRAAEPIRHSGVIIHATLSIGATLAIPGEPATTATTRADAAMYQAKEAGRNTVVRA